jgi:hypothetical protein
MKKQSVISPDMMESAVLIACENLGIYKVLQICAGFAIAKSAMDDTEYPIEEMVELSRKCKELEEMK